MSMEDGVTTGNQFLSFVLDKELYALDISKVREVLEFQDITKIPRTPDYFKGIINLRGQAVPVVDLRLKFGMSKTEQTVDTCIIIVEVAWDGDEMILGALADSVREVFELAPENIDPAPKMGTHVKADYIQGMGKFDNRFIMILDVDKVFSGAELTMVKEIGEGETPEERLVAATA